MINKKVTIKSITLQDDYDISEMTVVEVDGKEIGRGRYAGEPEDNFRFRDYSWVESLLEKLSKELGAEADIQQIDGGDEAKKYFDY